MLCFKSRRQHRTVDLPVDGKINQTTQDERFKGEFDTNFVLFVVRMINYRF